MPLLRLGHCVYVHGGILTLQLQESAWAVMVNTYTQRRGIAGRKGQVRGKDAYLSLFTRHMCSTGAAALARASRIPCKPFAYRHPRWRNGSAASAGFSAKHPPNVTRTTKSCKTTRFKTIMEFYVAARPNKVLQSSRRSNASPIGSDG